MAMQTDREKLILKAHIKLQKDCVAIADTLNELEKLGVNVIAQRLACLTFVNLCSDQATQLKKGVL